VAPLHSHALPPAAPLPRAATGSARSATSPKDSSSRTRRHRVQGRADMRQYHAEMLIDEAALRTATGPTHGDATPMEAARLHRVHGGGYRPPLRVLPQVRFGPRIAHAFPEFDDGADTVWERSRHVRAPFDLLVQPLERISAVERSLMLDREVPVREYGKPRNRCGSAIWSNLNPTGIDRIGPTASSMPSPLAAPRASSACRRLSAVERSLTVGGCGSSASRGGCRSAPGER